MSYKRELERQAEEAATVSWVDPTLVTAFTQGAVWVYERLVRMTAVHPLEDSAGARGTCDRFRLKEVNKFLNEVGEYKKLLDSSSKSAGEE